MNASDREKMVLEAMSSGLAPPSLVAEACPWLGGRDLRVSPSVKSALLTWWGKALLKERTHTTLMGWREWRRLTAEERDLRCLREAALASARARVTLAALRRAHERGENTSRLERKLELECKAKHCPRLQESWAKGHYPFEDMWRYAM